MWNFLTPRYANTSASMRLQSTSNGRSHGSQIKKHSWPGRLEQPLHGSTSSRIHCGNAQRHKCSLTLYRPLNGGAGVTGAAQYSLCMLPDCVQGIPWLGAPPEAHEIH